MDFLTNNPLNDRWVVDLDKIFGLTHRHARVTPCFAKAVLQLQRLGVYNLGAGYCFEGLEKLLLADKTFIEPYPLREPKQELDEWKFMRSMKEHQARADGPATGPEELKAHTQELFRFGLSDRIHDIQLAELTAMGVSLESGRAFLFRHGRHDDNDFRGQVWTYSFCMSRWVDAREISHCRYCDECVDGTRHWHCSACKKCRESIWVACEGCGGKSGIWHDEPLAMRLMELYEAY